MTARGHAPKSQTPKAPPSFFELWRAQQTPKNLKNFNSSATLADIGDFFGIWRLGFSPEIIWSLGLSKAGWRQGGLASEVPLAFN
jgi:hypothetical protein